MISVIICSVNPDLAVQVKRNIGKTIGVPHELIIIDNRATGKGICEVYNEGAKISNYDLLCFVHEDVIFNTPGWGAIVAAYFESDKELGLIGVAGSKYKSRTPSGWFTGIREFDCCNICHIDPEGREQLIVLNPDPGVTEQQVTVADGVFMCARKAIAVSHPFNEADLKGFHVYDIDFSVRVSMRWKLLVTFNIELVHHTKGGDFGNAWATETLKWHHANKMLPLSAVKSPLPIDRVEDQIFRNWLNRLKTEKISVTNRFKWLLSGIRHFMHPATWIRLPEFMFFQQAKRLIKR